MASSAPGEWTCPTCGAVVATPFCAHCGERQLEPRDLSLRGLFERAFHALTDLDGKVLRTFWALLRHPGALTKAYVTGQRKPYVAPFQVFLLANVLFFAVQSVSATHIFGAGLDSHLHTQDWQALAQTLTQARLAHSGQTLAQYTLVFDHAVEGHAKTLIILMALPFALLLALLFHRKDRPFAVHAVMSLHVWSFLLIVFSLLLSIADLDALQGGPGLRSARWDNMMTASNVLACALYLFLGVRPVYGTPGIGRVAGTLLLTLSMGLIVLGYRFTLFLLTLYTTT